ncbi:MAG: hypothetical protein K6T34_05185 [Thermoflavifilum sp.]|nr:hypothetical protein [Thermoflavifilum sp.]
MSGSISILLGAGFSAPKGYPTGNQLSTLLYECGKEKEIAFHTNGKLIVLNEENKHIHCRNHYDCEFAFLKKLMKYFCKSRGYFDYEEFYDFIRIYATKDEETHEDKEVLELAKPFLGKDYPTVSQLFFSLDDIYDQLIRYFLKDEDGEQYYLNIGHIGKSIFPGYTGILNCLEDLSKRYIINVHTLNHDLFFERLDSTDWLSSQLCDGFNELGSPYYGVYGSGFTGSYIVRMPMYTGKYDKKIRLYKLHGSIDYAVLSFDEPFDAKYECCVKKNLGLAIGIKK